MKARIRTFIDKILFTPKLLPEGTYQGTHIFPDGQTCRLHLRIGPSGDGLLIVNASTILHLNNSAAEFAYHIIQGSSEKNVVDEITKRYRIASEQVTDDYQTFLSRIESLILSPDLDPETFLDIDRLELHQDHLSAPIRIDCALTYQVSEGVSSVLAPVDRIKRLIDTDEWKTVLKKAWDKGILHAVFTGGEPTLRPDLIELISYSEQLGQVTGLITDGLRISEKGYLPSLLEAGLDHVMLVLDPASPESWEGLKDLVNEDIALTVHITVNRSFIKSASETLKNLKDLGVTKISLSAESLDLNAMMHDTSRRIHELGLTLVWDLPVPYSDMNPISMELQNSDNVLKGAARTWVYIEPDGDVLPGQGINTVLGNAVTDSWESIWSAAKIWLNESR